MPSSPSSSPTRSPQAAYSPRPQQRARTRTPTTPRRHQASTSTSTSTSTSDIELGPIAFHTPRSHHSPRTPRLEDEHEYEQSPFSDRHSVQYATAQSARVTRGHEQLTFARQLDYGEMQVKHDLVWEGEKEEAFMKAYERFDEHERISYPPLQSPPMMPAAGYTYPSKTLKDHPDLQPPEPSPTTPTSPKKSSTFDELIKPRFRLLFALTTRRDAILHILPATTLSIIASIIPPYMTVLIGDLFIPFSAYPTTQSLATPEQKTVLVHDVSAIALKLALVGAAGFVVHTLVGRVWIGYGERVADRLRRGVYEAVVKKEMAWFDLGMGMKGGNTDGEGASSENVGAGGLMAKFARETDDVRLGCSLAMGDIVQNTLTFILCLILALTRSPILALITLSAIPLVVVSHLMTQLVLTNLYTTERRAFAEASTHVERSTNAIATVKAFNAQSFEAKRFLGAIRVAEVSLEMQGKIWGSGEGVISFFTSVMFVAGFWFGAKLVREGKITVGDVMTVFWACLMASSSLQAIVPVLAVVTQGKNSMASQLTIIQSGQPSSSSSRPVSTINPFSPAITPSSARFSMLQSKPAAPLTLRRIRPTKCRGEIVFKRLSFAYPSRSDQLVLNDVSLFLPAGETTFVVGGSGSGKSTIAQLLLKLYVQRSGDLTMDDQDFRFLDESFTREHIAAVQQGCILFDMSVHDNVALGVAGSGTVAHGKQRRPEDVTREEVTAACKMALIHEFIIDLPEGYDTKLGTGGSSLSGGQKQRLSIARARLRDPTILILDEATSALDATSRVLVFEALKHWRLNRTTIVITHDLSQIQKDDFVYVMKDGSVVEQGFRSDLVAKRDALGLPGVFAGMAQEQSIEPFPMTEGNGWRHGQDAEEQVEELQEDQRRLTRPTSRLVRAHTPSFQFGLRPASAMYLGILDDYAGGDRDSVIPRASHISLRPEFRLSWIQPRPSSIFGIAGKDNRVSMGNGSPGRRDSKLLAVPSSTSLDKVNREEVLDSRSEKSGLQFASTSTLSAPATATRRRTWKTDTPEAETKVDVTTETGAEPEPLGPLRLIRAYFPELPAKYLLVLGIIASVAHGVMTPVWSSYISVLMSYVSTGGTDTAGLTRNGISLICICAGQSIAIALSASCLEVLSNKWAAKARARAFNSMLSQEKAWFDSAANSPSRLMQVLIKDADDMRALMSNCIGHLIVAVTMIGLGLIWAMIVGWRLTLVGLAISPVFGALMVAEATVLSKMEVLNKRRREDVARAFYETVANVRSVRAMAMEGVFRETFEELLVKAHATGLIAGWVKGLGTGASSSLPFFAQALLNWVSAVFIAQGYYTYAQTLQVYALVLFSITFGAQMLDFIPQYAKSRIAASDFHRLYTLSTETEEAEGELRFPITGNIVFDHVTFAYPSRPDNPVLTDVSFKLTPGETVAIVGPSGSGKSTIAALLQRLYDPSGGNIFLNRFKLNQADVRWLRNHIAVVSQNANLFDGTIAENIAYGSDVPIGEIHRAAQSASVHDFIMSLPDAYETNLGENASLISGGQAQRLQIARALVRPSNIMILDECTSALDVENARAVLDTIVKVKSNRTTIFITHSAEAMKRCDRILCLGDGRIVEDGSYAELIEQRGVFAELMSMGEWE